MIKAFYYSLRNKYYEMKYGMDFEKKQIMNNRIQEQVESINDSILPLSFKQTDDGKYIQTNDTFIQCLVVGRLSPKVKDRQDFPDNLDPRLIDDILNIATKKETSIELCQVIYPLEPGR